MKKTAFVIENITEYGKLIAYATHRNYYVGNATWSGTEKHPKGFYILDFESECLYFKCFFTLQELKSGNYDIVKPVFEPDEYGYDIVDAMKCTQDIISSINVLNR